MERANVVYDTAVVCDDVRMEITGKLILIGVVSSELLLPAFPTQLMICLYVEGAVVSAGLYSSSIRVIDDDSGILFTAPPVLPEASFVVGRFAQVIKLTFTIQRALQVSVIANDGQQDHLLLKRGVKLADPALPGIAHLMGVPASA